MQSQKDSFLLAPIGVIRTVFENKFGTPRQGALAPHSLAHFELEKRWQNKGAFEGIEGFSHLWLVSQFHQNTNVRMPSKIHPPRLLGKSVGVFASRSPHRPNNLGLTLAKLERRKGDKIWLSGVDLVDGTPIMDIKPYLPEADRPATFTRGWAADLHETNVACIFAPEAEADLDSLVAEGKITHRADFVKLVVEVLRLDPRPLSYRGRLKEKFAVVLAGLDVHAFHDQDQFTVISVKPYR